MDSDSRASPLSDSERNELVLQYRNIVYYYANRYRFFDPEIEEVQAWGFLGLARVINRYENDPEIEIEKIVFSTIRKEILYQYTKSRLPDSESNLQNAITENLTLENVIVDKGLSIDDHDIREMIELSLFEQDEVFKQINLDYYLTPKSISEIATKYNVTELFVSRAHRQGQALIKLYLVNNDVILDSASHPSEERKRKERIVNHKELLSNDFGKVKYIRKHFSFLSINDIASLMDTSSYMIAQVLDYPTTTYIQSPEDDSIAAEALKYCEQEYPERLPSEVKVYMA